MTRHPAGTILCWLALVSMGSAPAGVRLDGAVARAVVIIRAKVIKVYPPPPRCQRDPMLCYQSHIGHIGQAVDYEVLEVLRGGIEAREGVTVKPGARVTVSHALDYEGGDVGVEHEYRLREDLFKPGQELVVLVDRVGTNWLWSSFTWFGAMRPDSAHARRVREILAESSTKHRPEPAP